VPQNDTKFVVLIQHLFKKIIFMKLITLLTFSFFLLFCKNNEPKTLEKVISNPKVLLVEDSLKIQNKENTKGCGAFSIFHKIAKDKIIHFSVNAKKTTFSTEFQTYENIEKADFAKIQIDQNAEIDKLWRQSCNDVLGQFQTKTIVWTLKKGKFSYKVNKASVKYECGMKLKASVILEDAEFVNETGSEIYKIDRLELNDVKVGNCKG
jgi:hypothetical protein